MSSVNLIVRDAVRQIEGQCHGGFADAVIAAMSAQPETIEELEVALERFIKPGEWSYFHSFRSSPLAPISDAQPFDAGLVIVDLIARVVASDSTYSFPAHEGWIAYHDGQTLTDIDVGYHLSDDWHLVGGSEDWAHRVDARRAQRLANPTTDVRAILFGRPMIEFIVRHAVEQFAIPPGAEAPTSIGDDAIDEQEERDYETIRQIHTRWLLTPRADLADRCPRQVLMAQREYVDASLQDREEQWSLMLTCPRALDPASAAYRYAPFGTTEKVLYYDLLRGLLWSCRDSAKRWRCDGSSDVEAFISAEIERLQALREVWLAEPNIDYEGSIPGELIHNERARIPEGRTGDELMFDCDCPLCRMEAESGHVGFFHFDGCNMDDEFAFSIYHDTLEEWEAEQRKNEEFERKWREDEEAEQLAGGSDRGTSQPRVWKSSYSAPPSGDEPPIRRLFAIGSHLAELISDVRQRPDAQELTDRLNGAFGAVAEVVSSADPATAEALLEPVLDRFVAALEAIAVARPDLQLKCDELRRQANLLLRPAYNWNDSGMAADEDLF